MQCCFFLFLGHCDGQGDNHSNSSSKRPSLKSFHRSRFGSELTLPDANEDFALSECQSEADLRGYATMTEDEDDRRYIDILQDIFKFGAKGLEKIL